MADYPINKGIGHSVEDIAWMALGGKELHQSMLSVLVVQVECSPYKQ